MKARLLHALNIVFLIAYTLSAAVQLNDPDPIAWIAIYLSAAGLCGLQYLNRLKRIYIIPVLALSAIWMLLLIPGFIGQVQVLQLFESISMKSSEVELAREAGGLAFIVVWLSVLLVTTRR